MLAQVGSIGFSARDSVHPFSIAASFHLQKRNESCSQSIETNLTYFKRIPIEPNELLYTSLVRIAFTIDYE